MNGCRELLGKFIFSKIYSAIELRCGDIIWNEVEATKRRLLCSKCQGELESEVGK